MDAPGGRKIHSGFIPSMGGIGFILATFISVAIWFSYENLLETRFFLAAFGLIFFVGLRDDLVNLTAWQKLGAQVVAAYMVVVMTDIRLTGLYGFMGIYDIPLWSSYLLSIFTILSLTNAFNLIDGLDGLAGSLSLIPLVFLGWWFASMDMMSYSLFSFALVGGICSFLLFNWHPAKIFMGDTGSLSIGFALAVLTVYFIDTNANSLGVMGVKFAAPIATGIAILIVPIYDTSRVFIRRMMQGKSPMSPDKSHVHHFLMRMGFRHDQVTLILISLKIFFIGIIFLGSNFSDYVMLPVVILTAVIFGLKLDAITLKQVKKNNSKAPPILAKRKNKTKSTTSKTKVSAEILEDAKISNN
ncbi:undecaprenyl-phosphate alpha-N-acetylglucosaminyl 1-phosphate transferase [Mongoliitalea lutea]|uniref:Undecaprenyl-phosphate alpha-N-acetylglucosaminyl 1-phosphate transferase n=2 Tax=Mongoliitalea lutea TaxID=849756 RepID=A0A8J3CX56_9BACT|nr:undecaprenyl-phosphate alpha-N-acetylglucosaminyl 1-phosphate transferase [Mongoliitalea lutea]